MNKVWRLRGQRVNSCMWKRFDDFILYLYCVKEILTEAELGPYCNTIPQGGAQSHCDIYLKTMLSCLTLIGQ